MQSREPTASVDAKLIKQALLNLVLNATQAMAAKNPPPPGGSTGALAPGVNGDLILRTEDGKDPDGRRVVRLHEIDNRPGDRPGRAGADLPALFHDALGGLGPGAPHGAPAGGGARRADRSQLRAGEGD